MIILLNSKKKEREYIIEKIILRTYLELTKKMRCPTIVTMHDRLFILIERDGLDLMFPDINFNLINENVIQSVLNKYGCLYSSFGVIFNNPQNLLIEEFRYRVLNDT